MLVILTSVRKNSDTQKLVELVFNFTPTLLADYKIEQYAYNTGVTSKAQIISTVSLSIRNTTYPYS